MRTDIYSCRTQLGSCLVELHTSNKKLGKMKAKVLSGGQGGVKAFEGKSSEFVRHVADSAAKALQSEEAGQEIDKIIVDQKWKKVVIVKKDGTKVKKTVEELKKAFPGLWKAKESQAPTADVRTSRLQQSLLAETAKVQKAASVDEVPVVEESDESDELFSAEDGADLEEGEVEDFLDGAALSQEEVAGESPVAETAATEQVEGPVLLATDDQDSERYVEGKMVQKGATTITKPEQFWKAQRSLTTFIRNIFRRNKKSVGEYDFALHFFSNELGRKELLKKEVSNAGVLAVMADFFEERGIAPDDVDNMRQAADWMKQIEKLRGRSRSHITKNFGKIAQDMQGRCSQLENGDSMLVPFSSYYEGPGKKASTVHLMRITRDDSEGGEVRYNLELVGDYASDTIKQIPEEKLNLEDFFKPLVDIQTPASFMEESTGLLNTFMSKLMRFALKHPRIALWMAGQGTSSEQRGVLYRMMRHARETVLGVPLGTEETQLNPEYLAEQIFAPLLEEGQSVEVMKSLFEPRPMFGAQSRRVDPFLPLAEQRQQVEIETQSLFQFYYLYEGDLSTDPTTMQVMEDGAKRVASLQATLIEDGHTIPQETIEMLQVIETRIATARRQMKTQSVNTDERVSSTTLPGTFRLEPPGKTQEFAQGRVGVKAQKTVKAEALQMPQVDRKAQDRIAAANRSHLETADRIADLQKRTEAVVETLASLAKQVGKEESAKLDDFGEALGQLQKDIQGMDDIDVPPEFQQIVDLFGYQFEGSQALVMGCTRTLETPSSEQINELYRLYNAGFQQVAQQLDEQYAAKQQATIDGLLGNEGDLINDRLKEELDKHERSVASLLAELQGPDLIAQMRAEMEKQRGKPGDYPDGPSYQMEQTIRLLERDAGKVPVNNLTGEGFSYSISQKIDALCKAGKARDEVQTQRGLWNREVRNLRREPTDVNLRKLLLSFELFPVLGRLGPYAVQANKELEQIRVKQNKIGRSRHIARNPDEDPRSPEKSSLSYALEQSASKFTKGATELIENLYDECAKLQKKGDLTQEQLDELAQILERSSGKVRELDSSDFNELQRIRSEVQEAVAQATDKLEEVRRATLEQVQVPTVDLAPFLGQIEACYEDRKGMDPEQLKYQLSTIIDALPIDDLEFVDGFWANSARFESMQIPDPKGEGFLQTSPIDCILHLREMIEGIATKEGDPKPELILQLALCDCILLRLDPKNKVAKTENRTDSKTPPKSEHQQEIIEAKKKLRKRVRLDQVKAYQDPIHSPFMRFAPHLQQKQHAIVELTVAKATKRQDYARAFANRWISGAQPLANEKSILERYGLHDLPDHSFESAYRKSDLRLLERYHELRGHDEASTLEAIGDDLTQGFAPLDYNEIMVTNARSPGQGLQELLVHLTTPDMMIRLNDTDVHQTYAKLRLLVASRMLEDGHMAAFVTDQERVESTIEALDAAIAEARRDGKAPFAYVTLMEVKAKVLLAAIQQFTYEEDHVRLGEARDALEGFMKELESGLEMTQVAYELHGIKLSVFAQQFADEIPLKLSNEDFVNLMCSWVTYREGPENSRLHQRDEVMISRFFQGVMLPRWSTMEVDQKTALIEKVLVLRGKRGKGAAPLDWTVKGECFTARLGPSEGHVEANLVQGQLFMNGSTLKIEGRRVAHDLFDDFPLTQEPKLDGDSEELPDGSIEFRLKGFAGCVFRAKREAGEEHYKYAARVKGRDGKEHWYHFTAFSDVPKKEKEAKEPGKIGALIQKGQETILKISDEDKEQLDQMMGVQEEQHGVPLDILQKGVWLREGKPSEGVVIGDGGEVEEYLSLANTEVKERAKIETSGRPGVVGKVVGKAQQTAKRVKARVTGSNVTGRSYNTRITGVRRRFGDRELKLVNNPKSSLYQRLCGMTDRYNIKMWADSSGRVQEVEVRDPRMSFSRDAKTGRLMSNDLSGFYIAENQSIPVGDLAADWSNYLVLENDEGKRKLVMRQAPMVRTARLTPSGIEAHVDFDRTIPPDQKTALPFVDVDLVPHPEKGVVLQSTKPAANYTLALGAMQSGRFEAAMGYARAAARSAPMGSSEIALVAAIFAQQQEAFEEPSFDASGDGPFGKLIAGMQMMMKLDLDAPSLAAVKLATLASVLEQDLSGSRGAIHQVLPDNGDVADWLKAYQLGRAAGLRDESVSLNADEYTRICLHFKIEPDEAFKMTLSAPREVLEAARSREAQEAKRAIEGQPKPVTKASVSLIELFTGSSQNEQLIELLAKSSQADKAEPSMSLYAGSYVIKHFEDLYHRIDTAAPDSPELAEIEKQLNRYQDASPAGRSAIDFLQRMLACKQRGIEIEGAEALPPLAAAGAIEDHVAVAQCRLHAAQLRAEGQRALAQFDALKFALADIAPPEKMTELTDQRNILERLVKPSSPGGEATLLDQLEQKLAAEDAGDSLDALFAELQAQQKGIAEVVATLHKQVKDELKSQSLIKSQPNEKLAMAKGFVGLDVPERVSEKQDYKGLDKGIKLTMADQKQIYKWAEATAKGETPKPPAAFKKLPISNHRTLWDHLNAPETVPLPAGQTLESVLRTYKAYVPADFRICFKREALLERLAALKEEGATDLTALTDAELKDLAETVSFGRVGRDTTLELATFRLEFAGQKELAASRPPDERFPRSGIGKVLEGSATVQTVRPSFCRTEWGINDIERINEAFDRLIESAQWTSKVEVPHGYPNRVHGQKKLNQKRVEAFFAAHADMIPRAPIGVETDESEVSDSEEVVEAGGSRADSVYDLTPVESMANLRGANLIDPQLMLLCAEGDKDPLNDLWSRDQIESLSKRLRDAEEEALMAVLAAMDNAKIMELPNAYEVCVAMTESKLAAGAVLEGSKLPAIMNQPNAGALLIETAHKMSSLPSDRLSHHSEIDRITKRLRKLDERDQQQLAKANLAAEWARAEGGGFDALQKVGQGVVVEAPDARVAEKDGVFRLPGADGAQVVEQPFTIPGALFTEPVSAKTEAALEAAKVRLGSAQECQAQIAAQERDQANAVNELRRVVLGAVNKLPDDPVARQKEELRRLSGGALRVEVDVVFQYYAQDRMGELKALNPNLTDADIEALTLQVTEHHIEATKGQTLKAQLDQAKRTVELQKKLVSAAEQHPVVAQSLGHFMSLTHQLSSRDPAERAQAQFGLKQFLTDLETIASDDPKWQGVSYTPQELGDDLREWTATTEAIKRIGGTRRQYDARKNHPHTRAALAYEYTLGVVFRDHQIEEFTKRVGAGTPEIVSWLGTGFGKTFMAPGLAKMMATGRNLVCVVDTKDLIPSTAKSRDADSRAVYGQAAYRFQFARDPDRTPESMEEMYYRLLNCVEKGEYVVTSKEALGSLALQLLTWQRMALSQETTKYDRQIELAQGMLSLFRERGVALGDEIHQILNVIEALDYAEGDMERLNNYHEYYEATSVVFSLIYPARPEGEFAERSQAIADKLKIAENRQAQVNAAHVEEAVKEMAELIIDQALYGGPDYETPMHEAVRHLIDDLKVSKEDLVAYILVGEPEEGVETTAKKPPQVDDLSPDQKRQLATLKEELGSTFGKVLKKVVDEDFGLNTSNGLSICPYDKGRAQPEKEFDDLFQTLMTHYMWYGHNGVPTQGLTNILTTWKERIEVEAEDYPAMAERPTYKLYQEIFGATRLPMPDPDNAEAVAALGRAAKDHPDVIYKFLETCVFPDQRVYPSKIGFNSMDLVSLFHKFGGYSGTIQTQGSFSRQVMTDEDNPEVNATAEKNFQLVYGNPANFKQNTLPDHNDPAMVEAQQAAGTKVAPLTAQLEAGGVNIQEYRAIIDCGGLFKELTYMQMAQDILSKFPASELEAVLIYNDAGELGIVRRGSDEWVPFDPKTVPPDPKMRFTVYRQPQITGSDIPQNILAKALVTVNEKTRWGDFEQGVGRMRKAKEGQTFSVVYRGSLAEKVAEDVQIVQGKVDAAGGEEHADPKLVAELYRLRGIQMDEEGSAKDTEELITSLTEQLEEARAEHKRHFDEELLKQGDEVAQINDNLREAEAAVLAAQAKIESGEEDEGLVEFAVAQDKVDGLQDRLRKVEAREEELVDESLVLQGRIDQLSLQKEQAEERLARIKAGARIDIKALTKGVEDQEIKMRRYYAAVSGMEDILKSELREHLCTGAWKEVHALFGDILFEASLKSDEQMLEVKQAVDPLVSLEKLRQGLLGRIQTALDEVEDPGLTTSLVAASLELKAYQPPSAEKLPEKVVGTQGESTKETEVQKETEKQQEVEKEQELEVLQFQVTGGSRAEGKPKDDWVNWEPRDLLGITRGGDGGCQMRTMGDPRDAIPLLASVEVEDLTDTKGLTQAGLKSGETCLVDPTILFRGVVVTQNFIQRRPGTSFPESLFSSGQKPSRAVYEVSFRNAEGEREFTHILGDLKDHEAFEIGMKKVRDIMTTEFRQVVEEFMEGHPDLKHTPMVDPYVYDELVPILGTDNAGEQLDVLIEFFGEGVTLEQLTTAAVRVKVDGKCTAACGALGRKASKAVEMQALEGYVRAKLVRGELGFNSQEERQILEHLITVEYAKVFDFDEFRKNLHREEPGLTEPQLDDRVAQKRQEMAAQGVRGYDTLMLEEAQEVVRRLNNFFGLYKQAAMSVRPNTHDVNPGDYRVGQYIAKIQGQLVDKHPTLAVSRATFW